jgi:hypothetical protein
MTDIVVMIDGWPWQPVPTCNARVLGDGWDAPCSLPSGHDGKHHPDRVFAAAPAWDEDEE